MLLLTNKTRSHPARPDGQCAFGPVLDLRLVRGKSLASRCLNTFAIKSEPTRRDSSSPFESFRMVLACKIMHEMQPMRPNRRLRRQCAIVCGSSHIFTTLTHSRILCSFGSARSKNYGTRTARRDQRESRVLHPFTLAHWNGLQTCDLCPTESGLKNGMTHALVRLRVNRSSGSVLPERHRAPGSSTDLILNETDSSSTSTAQHKAMPTVPAGRSPVPS